MYSLPSRLRVIAIELLFGISLPRQVDGDDGKAFPEQWQYAPPGVPALWKAGQKGDNRTAAPLHEMNAQSSSLDMPMRKWHSRQDELLLFDHGSQLPSIEREATKIKAQMDQL